jgi:16S rRNA (cytosine1402-N4)-methyltransferase
MTTASHFPVMCAEVVTALQPRPGWFIDCTLGLGGHSEALLTAHPDLQLLAIDRDGEALALAQRRLATFGSRVTTIQADFRDLATLSLPVALTTQPIYGILADLGVSSWQLDEPTRGFSFQQTGPLDMRMDQRQLFSAQELVNQASEQELADLIYQLGEEPAARAIARQIVQARAKQPLTTTTELAQIVANAARRWYKRAKERTHPATRTFQALRIAVNDELTDLATFVATAINWLAPQGRLAIISFHSLEDREIKQAYRFASGQCQCPPRWPQCVCGAKAQVKIITKKALTATATELAVNTRSRSAKLRVCEKL